MIMFYALVALCFTSTALAQIAGLGPCPAVKTMPDFQLSKIEGKWHEVKRYFATFEMNLKCINSDFRDSENDTMLLDASAISTETGKLTTVQGINVRVVDSALPSKLQMRSASMLFWRDYWILGTDYDSYKVAYSCVDFKFMNFKYLWISTREQHPSDAVMQKALEVMDKQNLDQKDLLTSDQLNCVVKPVFDEIKDSEEFNIFY